MKRPKLVRAALQQSTAATRATQTYTASGKAAMLVRWCRKAVKALSV